MGLVRIFDYYTRYGVSGFQHEQMAAHYRNTIVNILKEVDNSQENSLYDALAWVGLIGRGPIDSITGLHTNPTSAWSNLSQMKRLTILNTISNLKVKKELFDLGDNFQAIIDSKILEILEANGY